MRTAIVQIRCSIGVAIAAWAAAFGSGCSSETGDPLAHGSLREPVIQVDPPVAIRQLYGGGGNTGAVFTNDFVELFNRSSGPISLGGWSVQYTSATGTGLLGGSGLITLLPAVTLAPGQSFLVQEASG